MLRALKMHGMAQAVGELTEQGSPAFEAALPILSQLLKAETADREVRSTAYQLKAARFPSYRDLAGFDFASSEVNEALVRQLYRCEFLGRRPQRRVCRRAGPFDKLRRENPSRHRHRRPGHRASPQARALLLLPSNSSTPWNKKNTKANPVRSPDASPIPTSSSSTNSATKRQLRRNRRRVQPLRRGAAVPPSERALRAHPRHHHHKPQLRRMGRSLRRREDDEGAARPPHPPLPHP